MQCRTCGAKTLYGDLFCSVKHQVEWEENRKAWEEHLISIGFEKDRATPNIFRKNGVAVTTEHISHVGLDQAILDHANSIRAHALGVRLDEPVAH